MLKTLAIAAACTGGLLATDAVAGQPAPALPDFPQHARPGECWARVPAGPAKAPGGHGAPSQAVWTLERGAGPGAVWSRSERPLAGGQAHGPAHGPLDWAQVPCGARPALPPRNGHDRHIAPPPPPPPPPLPPALHHGGPRHGPMAPHRPMHEHERIEPHAHSGEAHHGRVGPSPRRFLEHGAGPHPHHHAPETAPPMAVPFGPMHPPHFAPHPPRRPAAPWFGGRYLTWPGKTFR